MFLLPRTGGTESKVRRIRFVFLLGCFFSLDVYTKNTEKDIAVKRILFVFVRQELDVLRSTQN